MEKSCRNDCLACGMTGAFSLYHIFVGERWVGVMLCLAEKSVPGSRIQASAGVRDLTAATRFMVRSSSEFSRVGEEGHQLLREWEQDNRSLLRLPEEEELWDRAGQAQPRWLSSKIPWVPKRCVTESPFSSPSPLPGLAAHLLRWLTHYLQIKRHWQCWSNRAAVHRQLREGCSEDT